MPLPLKNKKFGAVEYVIKRLKGSDSYDSMKHDNEYGMHNEKLSMRKEPQDDYKMGMQHAVSEMMSSVERKDSECFERNLRAFIDMMLDEREDHEEMDKEEGGY